jgi:plastocyanin
MRSNRGIPWLARLFSGLCLLAAASCWGASYTVTAGGGALVFTPDTLTINVGDNVTFVNGGGFHNVSADDGSFTSGGPTSGIWSVSVTFTKPGTVGYHCDVHGGPGTGMFGTIQVQAAPLVNIGPGFTGAWYDPAQSGHGLFLEVLKNNSFLAWWFTFNPAGTEQSWFGGVGTYSGSTATITQVIQTTGGRWIPNFDPSKLVQVPWGSFTFTFTDCNNGRVDFNSPVPGYGTGSMTLSRLTLPAGLTCP